MHWAKLRGFCHCLKMWQREGDLFTLKCNKKSWSEKNRMKHFSKLLILGLYNRALARQTLNIATGVCFHCQHIWRFFSHLTEAIKFKLSILFSPSTMVCLHGWEPHQLRGLSCGSFWLVGARGVQDHDPRYPLYQQQDMMESDARSHSYTSCNALVAWEEVQLYHHTFTCMSGGAHL